MKLLVLGILLFPLFGVVINSLFGRNFKEPWAGVIATAAVACSFILGVLLFINITNLPIIDRTMVFSYFNWISTGPLIVDFALQIDPISICMILVVTGVGGLIHLYSIGYMAKDSSFSRYFIYLNLFIFMMLILVMGANLPLLFVGWEGVGLCSYLLIGFWFKDIAKAQAGKKAFIINRIGDACFLIGMFLILKTFGTLDFLQLQAQISTFGAAGISIATITVIALLLFGGATGKSAQIPLFVWLPDAMAGPTPVSALIHAATMVTAGVYMIIRLNFLYILSPIAMGVVATIGFGTALFAALIALSQDDIKKVLAYSTISQLGYMFGAVGVGAFAAGLFHLITHAFFKALLFLCAGSVIHALSGEQNIQKMGGLKKALPITSMTFLIGVLAISGIPLFSGFFSKDMILWFTSASLYGNWALAIVGFVTAGLTALYMYRVYALTFLGKPRVKGLRPHESPPSMAIALIVLGILSVLGGFIGLPEWSHYPNLLFNFIEPIARLPEVTLGHEAEVVVTIISIVFALFGILVGYYLFVRKPKEQKKITKALQPLPTWSKNKFYVDEIYAKTIVNPIMSFSRFCWNFIDVLIIDKTVNLVGAFWRKASTLMSYLQTGFVQGYAILMTIGTLFLIYFIFKG